MSKTITSKYTGTEIEARLDDVSNKVDEAPSDGNYYLRKDGEWVETSSGGDGSVDVVQTTGTSTVAVMSQAAVTEKIEADITVFSVEDMPFVSITYYDEDGELMTTGGTWSHGLKMNIEGYDGCTLHVSNCVDGTSTNISRHGFILSDGTVENFTLPNQSYYEYDGSNRAIYSGDVEIPEGVEQVFISSFIMGGTTITPTASVTRVGYVADVYEKVVGVYEKVPNVVQTTGDSTTDVMSQKAATESFLTTYSEELQDVLAYGIQFDTTISSPTCTRLGSSTLHKTLPIQSGMRGCRLSDDGEVNSYYLPSASWDDYVRDGSIGQVMVEIPTHYRKFVTDGTVRQVWLSEYPIEGYTKVPKMYVSAYEASLNRTTNTLASVVNTTTDYRGGNNNADYDGTYRSFLGRPATSISLTDIRTYARNRKADSTEWNCMTYEVQKTIYWLFVTEYATLNSQSAINAGLTSEGYKQGGLGDGSTALSSTNWSNFNGYSPFIPCGHTDSLGNGTGEVLYEVYDEGNDVTISTYANRYRGIENPFGHIWQWTDGIFVDVRTDDDDGDYAGESRVFVATDTADFASPSTLAESYEGYEYRGLQARTNSYIKEIIFGNYGDMMGEVVGGSNTIYFCDHSYTSVTSSTTRGVRFGGSSYYGPSAGFACSYADYAFSTANVSIGSRLCFHPNEN